MSFLIVKLKIEKYFRRLIFEKYLIENMFRVHDKIDINSNQARFNTDCINGAIRSNICFD